MKYPDVKINPIVKYLLIPRAIWLMWKYRLGSWLLKKRNKPMPFILHPDPVLSRVADPIDFSKDTPKELYAIVRKMGAALENAGYGQKLGLAAPQICISKRICIVQGVVMVNPEWTPSRAPQEVSIEGCYSVPHRTFKVMRDSYGWAKWVSIDGVPREFKLNGTKAIVFQHELDHLNGKCCADVGTEITKN